MALTRKKLMGINSGRQEFLHRGGKVFVGTLKSFLAPEMGAPLSGKNGLSLGERGRLCVLKKRILWQKKGRFLSETGIFVKVEGDQIA